MWRFLRNQSKCALQPGGSLHVRAFWSFQNEACILCAQHGDMICLTRCLTVDLLPSCGSKPGDAPAKMLLSRNVFGAQRSGRGRYCLIFDNLKKRRSDIYLNKITRRLCVIKMRFARALHWWDIRRLILTFISILILNFPHRCLAFTSQKCIGALMAAASVGPSPPAPVSQTASAMRRTSGAALGRSHMWSHRFFFFFFSVHLHHFLQAECFAGWAKRDLEKSATPASSWWNGGKSFLWGPRRTGTTWVSVKSLIWAVICFTRQTHLPLKFPPSRLWMPGEGPV